MSEMKGAMLSMLIFLFFIFPLLLSTGLNSLQQHAFIKTTTEFSDVIKNEGGVTSRIEDVVESLEDRGYSIDFMKDDGSPITDGVEYGDMLIVNFEYEYNDIRGMQTLNSQTIVPVYSR